MHFVPSIDRWHDSCAYGFFSYDSEYFCHAQPACHFKDIQNNIQKEEITYGLRELKFAEYPEYIVFFFLTSQI